MKIVSWNCHCAFRHKRKLLDPFEADVLVVQECENPQTSDDEAYRTFGANALWVGENPGKGLGVFARPGIRLQALDWEAGKHRHMLPVLIDGRLPLLAVWAMRPYMKGYHRYLLDNIGRLNRATIVIGDFNGNLGMPTREYREKIPEVVELHRSKGLVSLYHHFSGEAMGRESTATFHLQHNAGKPYHIDYCFADPDRIRSFSIAADLHRLAHSDHFPLIVDADA